MMREEGICAGCGGGCLGMFECSCGRKEVYACQDCLDSDMNLVCGVCRDRALRVLPLASYACRDFVQDEAGMEREQGERLPVNASVGA